MPPSSTSTDKDTFTVYVRSQPFKLTKRQIESEPGCFFSSALLGDFAEATSKTLRLEQHPATFSLIVDHLSGYSILPLTKEDCSTAGLSEGKLLRYLQEDAEYYGLKRLSAALKRTPIRQHDANIKLCIFFNQGLQEGWLPEDVRA